MGRFREFVEGGPTVCTHHPGMECVECAQLFADVPRRCPECFRLSIHIANQEKRYHELQDELTASRTANRALESVLARKDVEIRELMGVPK